MAHEDGIIKVDTTSTGVEIADIQAVIGSPKNDIGQLILSNDDYGNPRPNKWSKYKPVKMQGLDFPRQRNADFTWKTETEITTLGEIPWWRGYNGQCGLTFTTYSELYTGNDPFAVGSFLRKLITSPWPTELVWGYERPTGGINQYPFRFFDFNYYYHNADKPITGVNDIIRLFDDGSLTVQLETTRALNDLAVELSDLTINNSSLENWYIGVLIYRSSTVGEYMFAFSDVTIGNGADSVEFTNMTAYAGQYAKVVPFLSSVRSQYQGTSPGVGTFLSCDVEPEEIKIRAAATARVTIDAQWKYGYELVGYNVRIINDTGNTMSVTNMRVALYDGGQNVDYDDITDFTIPNGDPHDVHGTLDPRVYDSSKTYYVVVTSNNQYVNGTGQLFRHE